MRIFSVLFFLLGLVSPSKAQVAGAAFHGVYARAKVASITTLVSTISSTSNTIRINSNWDVIFPSPYMLIGKTQSLSVNSALRFTNLSIPAGSTIVTATMSTIGYNAAGDGYNTSAKISGERNINPASFSSDPSAYFARTKTTSTVPWVIPNTPWADPVPVIVTPDLKAIIQEIIGISGWQSGKNIVLFFEDDGTYYNISFMLRAYVPEQTSYSVLTIQYQ